MNIIDSELDLYAYIDKFENSYSQCCDAFDIRKWGYLSCSLQALEDHQGGTNHCFRFVPHGKVGR